MSRLAYLFVLLLMTVSFSAMAQNSSSQTAQDFFSLGIQLEEQGEYERAIEAFSEAIRLSPDMWEAYSKRGCVSMDYLMIILLNSPLDINSFFEEQSGFIDTAIVDLSNAIRLNPRDANSYFYRGFAYSAKYENILAIADYTQAINLDSGFVNAYFNRGNKYFILGDYERAISDISTAISITPNADMAAYSMLGYIYFHIQNYERAVFEFNRAFVLDPEQFFFYDIRGLCYIHLEEFELAISDLNRALQLDPSNELAREAIESLTQSGR